MNLQGMKIKSILDFPANPKWAAITLRVALGSMFGLHGIGKALVVGMGTVNENFVAHGFPVWTNYLATTVEVIAGLVLLVGVYTRWASFLLMPVTLGIVMYHFPNGWAFHNPGGGWEYPLLILAALLATFLLGDEKHRPTQKK